MAASSSSSSLAPIDFNFSSFDSSDGLSVAVERCPLCIKARVPFLCSSCLCSGDFCYSTRPSTERYQDKQERWDAKKREQNRLLLRIQECLQKKVQTDAKNTAMRECHEKVDLLRRAITAGKEALQQEKHTLKKSQDINQLKHVQGKKETQKLAHMIEHRQAAIKKVHQQRTTLGDTENDLAACRNHHIDELSTYVFPLIEVQPMSYIQSISDVESASQSTVCALKEATQMAYVHGRWVIVDNGVDVQYKILHSYLPANGDYSTYTLWAASLQESGSSQYMAETSHHSPAYEIISGLCLATQMVSMLAWVLNVHLPRRLLYSEFCAGELTEKQFTAAVAKLNLNILYLSFSQGVNPDLLQPKQTLRNICTLIRSQGIGREHPFDIHSELMESLADDISHTDESEDDHWCSEDDETDYGIEWETVSSELPDIDAVRTGRSPESTVSDIQITAESSYSDQALTAAGGLMTSAAASVVSFWKAATSHFDKR